MWSARALRIKFLANLVLESMSNGLADSECQKLFSKSNKISAKLSQLSSGEVLETRKTLLAFQKTPLSYFKSLKGKPLNRVFWQVANAKNIEDISSSL